VSCWLLAYLILAAWAMVQSLLLALQMWENRRYAQSGMRRLHHHRPTGRAVVIAPCKGIDVGAAENLRALFRQDYDDYEVTFVVESAADPVCAAIRRVMAEHPERVSRLVVAGLAVGSGQKNHNLRAATARLSPEIEYLAFVDSDAQPRPQWLRLLIARLDRPGTGATTGYRWFIPAQRSLPNCLLYSINCGAMMLLGRRSYYLIWGGSWAIRRELFDSLATRQTWKGSLSDDLLMSNVLRRAGLPTRFEPAAVVASPVQQTWREMFAFLRRQYIFGRDQMPHLWIVGIVGSSLANLAWLASLAAIGAALLWRSPWLWIPLGASAALYLISAYRGALRQSLVRSYFPEQYSALRAPRQFDIWAGPLAGLVNGLALLGSMFGRRIRWRGIEYHLTRDGRIRLVRHEALPAQWPAGDQADHHGPQSAAEEFQPAPAG